MARVCDRCFASGARDTLGPRAHRADGSFEGDGLDTAVTGHVGRERHRVAALPVRAGVYELAAGARILCTIVLTMRSEIAAGSSATQEFATRIGGRIRALRKQRGWSVQRLAENGQLSRRMLTDVELGQANPSLATVDRIARALGTDFAALALPERDAASTEVEGTVVRESPDGSRALLLGATANPRSELWRWTLAPGGHYDAEPDRPGAQEIHHVLTGRLTLATKTGPRVLAPGQSAVIARDQEYAYRNETTEPVVFLRVVTGA